MLSNLKNNYIFSISIILLLIATFWFFSNIVVYIVIAYILSLIGGPIVYLLSKIKIGKYRLGNGLKAFISLISIWLIIFMMFRVFVPLIGFEIKTLSEVDIERIGVVFEEPINFIENTFYELNSDDTEFYTFISEKIRSVLKGSFIKDIFTAFSSILGNVFMGLFSISFIAFFFLKDSYLFYRTVLLLVPDKYDSRTKHAMLKTQKLLTRYFIGLLIEVTLVATLIPVGLLIIGIPFHHAIVIGLFAGLLNIIPYIGPVIGAILGMLIVLILNLNLEMYDILPILGFTGLVFLIVQLSDNIIFQPIIYSNSVDAHPLEIFLVIIAAGSIAGIVGMILAVPTYTIFRVFASTFLQQFKVMSTLTKSINKTE